MLPTFVIGLREGLEAALIVGIVAAFLKRNGRTREMWALWTGVGLGVALCLAGGIALRIAERDLPVPAKRSFRQYWRAHAKERRHES